jgi:FtsH-binding integral membrane protein
MAEYDRRYEAAVRTGAGARVDTIDQGLRAFMLGIYNNMAIGLAITGLFAYGIAQWALSDPAVHQALYGSALRWVIMLAPLAFVFGLSAGVNRLSPAAARLVFFAFAAVMGVSLSSIFLVFTNESIARTFFVTAASFGALSLYGYTTKRDITRWSSFLFMGLIGLLLAMIVNIFLGSTAVQFAISVIGVLIFAGLTAVDTQRLKHTYDYVAGDAVAAGRASIIGALQLYLDFINLFMFLLQFMGNNRN